MKRPPRVKVPDREEGEDLVQWWRRTYEANINRLMADVERQLADVPPELREAARQRAREILDASLEESTADLVSMIVEDDPRLH